MQVLNKTDFMKKIIYFRLLWKYNIRDIENDDIVQMIKAFNKMIEVNDFHSELVKFEPISQLSFKNMIKQFIGFMKEFKLLPMEADLEDIDSEYIGKLVECVLYAYKMHLYVTYFASDLAIMSIKELKSIRGPFYNLGYTTLLDLAFIFTNTYDAKDIKGIGPQKYNKFMRWFCVEPKEFQLVEGIEV